MYMKKITFSMILSTDNVILQKNQTNSELMQSQEML